MDSKRKGRVKDGPAFFMGLPANAYLNRSLKIKNGHGKVRPCCLTPIEHYGGPGHVHTDTLPCFWAEGY